MLSRGVMEELLPPGAQEVAIVLAALLLRAAVGLSGYSGGQAPPSRLSRLHRWDL